MTPAAWPHDPSEAPAPLWGYFALSVGAAGARILVVGGVAAWILAVPSAIVFGWALLHGLRIIWQIALVFCIGSLLFAPASPGPLWLAAFPLLGLFLLLLPVSREFCVSNSAAEPVDS